MLWGIISSITIYFIYFLVSTTYGYDTITRALMGAQWLENPFLITHCTQVTWSFGPFQCYLNAISILITSDPNIGPRLFSTIFGILTVIPIYLISKELFDRRIARLTAAIFPFFTLFINLSVSGNSEPISAFFLLMTAYFLIRFSKTLVTSHILLAGLFMLIGTSTRYEVWLLIPFFTAFLLYRFWKTKQQKLLRGTGIFLLISIAFPILWMLGNHLGTGDYLNFIPREDRDNIVFMRGGSLLTEKLYRLVYFPTVLFVSLTPIVFLIATYGIIKNRKGIFNSPVAWMAIGYIIYYLTVFVILGTSILAARHINIAGLIMILFFGAGLSGIAARLSASKYRILKIMLIGSIFAIHIVLLPFNKPSDGWAERLRALSPVVQDPDSADMAVVKLEEYIASGLKIFIDTRFYNDRLLYLKLYDLRQNIYPYNGPADSFIISVQSADPDIIVYSPGNKRIREIFSATDGQVLLGSPDFAYERIDRLDPYQFYQKVSSQ
jgi:4-amino-4-deoxy-L-arabinose transferase-like glycosyltransferase